MSSGPGNLRALYLAYVRIYYHFRNDFRPLAIMYYVRGRDLQVQRAP